VRASSVNMSKNKIDITNYTSKTWDTLRSIVWTLDKPKNVHVHLQSRVNSLDGNLVKILFILT